MAASYANIFESESRRIWEGCRDRCLPRDTPKATGLQPRPSLELPRRKDIDQVRLPWELDPVFAKEAAPDAGGYMRGGIFIKYSQGCLTSYTIGAG